MLNSVYRQNCRLIMQWSKQVRFASHTAEKPKTAIVMLNMGGPKTTDQVSDYLLRIMTDRDMIQLPVQSKLGPWIASRRTEEVKKKYMEIGGGSPIYHWTDTQGKLLTKALDQMLVKSAPHKHYIAFRYVAPFAENALTELERDGVERVVIFSQYPQYSCATTGSSLNAIADFYRNSNQTNQVKWLNELSEEYRLTFGVRQGGLTSPALCNLYIDQLIVELSNTVVSQPPWVFVLRQPPKMRFSLIERWATNRLLAQVFAERIREKLELFDRKIRDHVLIMFTAHSLPLKAVSRGDTYPHEVAASVAATMSQLSVPNPHRLVWQSKVGPLPWLQPYTDDAIKAYAKQGCKHIILVPIAFVNEHIETLHELDIEYCDEVAKEAGITQIERAAAPNDHPTFIAAMADVVAQHLTVGPGVSLQYLSRCPHCVSQRCKSSKEFYRKLCGPEMA